MHETLHLLTRTDFPALRRRVVETLQVNLGYRCNQSCVHCHVNAGPNRTEEMSGDNIDALVAFLDGNPSVRTLDLTGGAPELNRHFRRLVIAARSRGVRVIDRCNLTILEEPEQEGLAEFLAHHRVDVVASMPCYLEDNVDRQRGKGVYGASIRGLQKLNALGYGHPDSELVLDLVYNPQGPSLPPPQAALSDDYRRHLADHFGVVFNQLFTLANMPIQRFGSMLVSKGQFTGYMELLRSAHREGNLDQVMCRSLLSVDWLGYVYDCDFNQQLGMPIRRDGRPRVHLSAITASLLEGAPIRVADHCYGCTAGQGSSCGGALADSSAPAGGLRMMSAASDAARRVVAGARRFIRGLAPRGLAFPSVAVVAALVILPVTWLGAAPAIAADQTLRFGVGLYQPDKDKNDATYRPLAEHLSRQLGRPVKLYTVDTWEGLAKSLAAGETDIALMGPWGYVLANHVAQAQAVATIEYDGKPEYFAIMITHPGSGIRSIADLEGKTFAFGDKGSTSGYLIPSYHFQKNGVDPETFLGRVLYTRHQAIEMQVTRGDIDAGADYNRNRDAMIAEGLIKPQDSVVFWTSDPLPNDAVAVSAELAKDTVFVARLRAALVAVGPALRDEPGLLPPRYTGFVAKDDSFYRPIRDAGLATGKLISR